VPVFSHVDRELTTLNLLKSVFISSFIAWLILLSFFAFIRLSNGGEPLLSWFGLGMAAFSPLLFFIKAFLFRSPRTPRHPVEYSILCGLGVAITLVMSYRFGAAAGSIHIWAGFTLLGWFAYLRWYSVFNGRHSKALRTGSELPEFRLESLEGHVVSSESFKARPHLLLFYRGNWCPFCTAQIEELAAAYQHLDQLGVKVILISPQSTGKNQALAARFDIPLVFLRDPDNAAARQLGIVHNWGTPMGLQLLGYGSDTVMPTVILTDAAGRIVYSDQTDNYRARPEPGMLIEVIKKNAARNA
jgi:peroxiredoxin